MPEPPSAAVLAEEIRAALGVVPPSDAPTGVDLRGPVEEALRPTGHLVCEGCGRIVRWDVPGAVQDDVARCAEGAPEGWAVHASALSLTGLCPKCAGVPPSP